MRVLALDAIPTGTVEKLWEHEAGIELFKLDHFNWLEDYPGNNSHFTNYFAPQFVFHELQLGEMPISERSR